MARNHGFALIFLVLLSLVAAVRASPDDAAISRVILNKLTSDRFLDPRDVRVASAAGEVTLSGTVHDLRSERRALAIARGVKGVRAVNDRLLLAVPSRPDPGIRADIAKAILLDPVTHPLRIDVRSQNGRVTLRGSVGTWAEKDHLEWIASGVSGVRAIENDVAVRPGNTRIGDREIARAIHERFEEDPWLSDQVVRWNVRGGQVELSGTVATLAQRDRAIAAAHVRGVRAVRANGLTVGVALTTPRAGQAAGMAPPAAANPGSAAPTAEELRRNNVRLRAKILDALTMDPRLGGTRVEVAVESGIARLTGSVQSALQRQAAEADARRVIGIFSVLNQLTIPGHQAAGRKPGPGGAGERPSSDSEIAEDVRSALRMNPVLPGNLSVDSHDGVVRLQGTVGTSFMRWTAEQVASSVRGVAGVENHIEVQSVAREPRQGDVTIADATTQALRLDPQLGPDDQLRVTVVDGVATMTGDVANETKKTAAIRDAIEGGAIAVVSEIRVKSAGFAGTSEAGQAASSSGSAVYFPQSFPGEQYTPSEYG